MKKAPTAATLEHIHDEPAEVQSSKAHLPKLSYRQAIQSYFLAKDAAIHQVGRCSPHVIQDLVEACIPTAKNPKSCAGDLKGLDFRDLIDRWYGLCVLKTHKATIPLYASKAEAEAARAAQQKERSA